jgi:hypothetical protein
MPARHTSPQDDLLLEADFESWLWSTKEGVGETSGQTAGSLFGEFALLKTGPAEETSFLRSVRILRSAISQGPKPRLKSDPDVFADALVQCSVARSARHTNPEPPYSIVLICHGVTAGAFCTSAHPHNVVSPTTGAAVVGMPRLHQSLGSAIGRRVAPIRRRTVDTEAFAANGYCFAKRHGKPNSQNQQSPRKTPTFAISPR